MTHIGDLVPKSGIYTDPGVVIEKKPDGSVVVDTEPLAINKYHRYRNTTGLTLSEKERFNSILDKIYKNSDNKMRIAEIQKEIDELRLDPESYQIVNYLRNQQSELVRLAKVLPRFYNVSEASIKT